MKKDRMKYIALVEWTDINEYDIGGIETIPFQCSKTLEELRAMEFNPIEGQIKIDMCSTRRVDNVAFMTPTEWFNTHRLKELDPMIQHLAKEDI